MKRLYYLLVLPVFIIAGCEKDPLKGYDSPERAILFYSVPGQFGETKITRTPEASVVNVTVAKDADLSAVIPTITVSDGAVITPASGEVIDFKSNGNKYIYKVKSASGETREWTVIITMSDIPLTPFPGLVYIPNTLHEWSDKVNVYSDEYYNNYLTRYSNWNGGDGCYSSLLPDGSLLWTFQDSFFGTVDDSRARKDNAFVRNAASIQRNKDRNSFEKLNPGDGNQAKTWVTYDYAGNENQDKDWYWPGDGQVYNNTYQKLLGHLKSTGSGAWDFAIASTDLAIYSLPDMKLLEILKDKHKNAANVDYGSGIFKSNNGYTYMYGVKGGFLTSFLYAARVAGNDLKGTWEYYTKDGWKSQPDYSEESALKLDGGNGTINTNGAVTQPNIFENGGKYYLVSQGVVFSRDIFLYEASSPVGPWTNRTVIYKVPAKYDSGTNDMITYNAFVHHALSQDGELVISYNINVSDFWSNFNNPGSADRYRPYFVRIFNWK